MPATRHRDEQHDQGAAHMPTGRASPLPPNGFASPPPSGLSDSAPLTASSSSLTRTHIDQALLRSPDHGVTLDLTHLGLADVGEAGAHELASIGREDAPDAESPIVRIALGHNRLATLPNTFALLSRLRYINLRNNSFSVFPPVLTQMPSLEILDIRRNKIKRFPAQPGHLVNLRVLSISRNKLTRLPPYLASFTRLENLGIDHNPIDWPPRAVLDPHGSDLSNKQVMKGWVNVVIPWGKLQGTYLYSYGSDYKDDLTTPSLIGSSSYRNHAFASASTSTPHVRSFSLDSDISAYSASDEPSPSHAAYDSRPWLASPTIGPSSHSQSQPPALHLDTHLENSLAKSRSPTRSPDSYLPTPDESVASTDEESTRVPQQLKEVLPLNFGLKPTSQSTSTTTPTSPLDHARNASYAGNVPPLRLRLSLTAKKSLPDLRTTTAGAKIHERRGAPDLAHLPMPSRSFTEDHTSNSGISTGSPLPTRWRQDSAGSSASASADAVGSAGPSSLSRAAAAPLKPFLVDGPVSASPISMHNPARSIDLERHAYFRRFSALHNHNLHPLGSHDGSSTASTPAASATGKLLPPPLIALVEGARAVLYALTQLHQTVIHHATHMADERLGAILSRVLDPSFAHIASLISALDRFDAFSAPVRNNHPTPHGAGSMRPPPPSACRALAEATRACVGSGTRVVKALAVQAKVIGTRDDPLYVRSLLLQIWGASAELGAAWARMAPQLDAAVPYLREGSKSGSGSRKGMALGNGPPVSRARGVQQVSPTKEDLPVPASAPPSASTFSPHGGSPAGSGSAVVTRSRSIHAPDKEEKARRARRHAGSFSARDVEIGKHMPPHVDDLPPVPGLTSPSTASMVVTSPMSSSTPTPRAAPHMESFSFAPSGSGVLPRKASLASVAGAYEASASRPGTGQSAKAFGSGLSRVPEGHSRHGSLTSSASASVSSSPSIPGKVPQLEIPLSANANTVADKDAMTAMRRTIEAALPVWEMLEEIAKDESGAVPPAELARAQAVTTSFDGHLRRVESGDATERSALRDDAHVFVKTVIHLANLMKPYAGPQVAPLRAKMHELSNATEETVILLHASSFSPPATPRSHSPMVFGQPNGGLSVLGSDLDGGRLGVNLSRSRSAQTAKAPQAVSSPREVPRSAAPHQQTFKLPPHPRLGPGTRRETGGDGGYL
ncbi:hypothetical protein PUNSTDRAFT_136193 [Punctularia strigosozonata HHB-11173 SS5]|uniref:uncharacterized protein n=1 Tax=Punctularia strigosozonata (strain HHB-11173) TaxID=741275 RepID=UPI0004417C95|nr:uncharacterized protein PUNSTDRAFT_136193 [Punctularia strigosozonata HHB-11173 SS5]EIN07514.1 hypothetical protein PUNSTDRAFT_136193 [Punctularia strigosozonata HHB-11173 SS5]